MGTNDAREQLVVCKDEYTKLEQELRDANLLIDRIEMYADSKLIDEPVYLDHIVRLIDDYRVAHE